VHARGQYVTFTSDARSIEVASFPRALNSRLPPDVSAFQAWHVRDNFHARYDAIRRHYRYYLLVSPVREPHRRAYAFRIPQWPNLDRMNDDATPLVGTRDFTTFAHRRDDQQRTTRTLYYAHFRRLGDTIEFAVGADGFLWRMVRSIVGTLVERERLRLRGERPAYTMGELIAAADRSRAGTTAPAWGLFLHDVEFSW
jgi:tRNA pseudouridine38-40 synthase